jgi:hypothetical protein
MNETVYVNKKNTKQILYNITRHGRHYTSDPRQQTAIRYIGYNENGDAVELTPTEYRDYEAGIVVGSEWLEAGAYRQIIEATQVSKLQVAVKIQVSFKYGPRKGDGWTEEHKMRGIVV